MDSLAIPIVLPVTKVTCLEDRAQVERRGQVQVPAGQSLLRLEKVSPLAVDRSLKVELVGATLVDGRVARAWKEKPKGGLPAEATDLRKRVRDLEWELEERVAATARLRSRLEVVQHARSDVLRSVAETTGVGRTEPGEYAKLVERVRAEDATIQEALRVAVREQQACARRLSESQEALARSEQALAELGAVIELAVQAASASSATLRVVYLVPCGVWRPGYRATLAAAKDGGRFVRVESEAVVWQRTGEDWKDVELAFSTARPTLGAAPPALADDRLSTRDKTDQEKKTIEVAVREEEIQTAGEARASAAAEMPGLDDGGEVQVLPARDRATIPSDGQPYRVPLFSFESPAQAELIAAPERGPLASLVARFENRGGRVLLAGPVDVVRDSGFVGRTQLKFAAVGETVKLSFGSEDAVRVTRDVVDKRAESKLSGRRTTARTVKLFASNAGGEPLRVAVEERIPVSEVSAVEVKLGACEPAPAGPNADGIVRFDLDLPARSQREARLEYEVSASAKVAGI